MRRRFCLWLVWLIAAALPLQTVAAAARMACAPGSASFTTGHAAGHPPHHTAKAAVDAGCSACCAATAPPSSSLALSGVPAPIAIAPEPVLPQPRLRAGRLERPPRPSSV